VVILTLLCLFRVSCEWLVALLGLVDTGEGLIIVLLALCLHDKSKELTMFVVDIICNPWESIPTRTPTL
jgi:hypothetical protein